MLIEVIRVVAWLLEKMRAEAEVVCQQSVDVLDQVKYFDVSEVVQDDVVSKSLSPPPRFDQLRAPDLVSIDLFGSEAVRKFGFFFYCFAFVLVIMTLLFIIIIIKLFRIF